MAIEREREREREREIHWSRLVIWLELANAIFPPHQQQQTQPFLLMQNLLSLSLSLSLSPFSNTKIAVVVVVVARGYPLTGDAGIRLMLKKEYKGGKKNRLTKIQVHTCQAR